MITSSKNGGVTIDGNVGEILNDFTNVIRAVHEIIKDNYNEETAREVIAFAGRVAFVAIDEEPDELTAYKATRELHEILERGGDNEN